MIKSHVIIIATVYFADGKGSAGYQLARLRDNGTYTLMSGDAPDEAGLLDGHGSDGNVPTTLEKAQQRLHRVTVALDALDALERLQAKPNRKQQSNVCDICRKLVPPKERYVWADGVTHEKCADMMYGKDIVK